MLMHVQCTSLLHMYAQVFLCACVYTHVDQWEDYRVETSKGSLPQVPLNGCAVFRTLSGSQIEDGAR